jgi:predicted RNA polymerase sigma factor
VLAGLVPAELEMHGLVALMEIQASRIPARLSPAGLPVPLPEQNRGRWDQLLIRRGFTALLRAERLGGPPGPYMLQAAIAACHARAQTAAETDWEQIASLYQALAMLTHSPIVKLNRAVAVAMAFGPSAAWTSWTASPQNPRWPATICQACAATCWARLGRHAEAAEQFRRAASLTRNIPERTVLQHRVDSIAAQSRQRRGRRADQAVMLGEELGPSHRLHHAQAEM